VFNRSGAATAIAEKTGGATATRPAVKEAASEGAAPEVKRPARKVRIGDIVHVPRTLVSELTGLYHLRPNRLRESQEQEYYAAIVSQVLDHPPGYINVTVFIPDTTPRTMMKVPPDIGSYVHGWFWPQEPIGS
jgi:hypothetical protein